MGLGQQRPLVAGRPILGRVTGGAARWLREVGPTSAEALAAARKSSGLVFEELGKRLGRPAAGKTRGGDLRGTVTPFTDPPYDYALDKTANIPDLITRCAGPR